MFISIYTTYVKNKNNKNKNKFMFDQSGLENTFVVFMAKYDVE